MRVGLARTRTWSIADIAALNDMCQIHTDFRDVLRDSREAAARGYDLDRKCRDYRNSRLPLVSGVLMRKR